MDQIHDIVALRQARAAGVKRMQEIAAAAESESRRLTAEERQEFDRVEAEVREIGEDIDRAESLRDLSGWAGRKANDLREGVGADKREYKPGSTEHRNAVTGTDEYRDAFNAYIRGGFDNMRPEQRGLLVETRQDFLDSAATHGGYLVPVDFAKLVISLKVPAVAIRRTRATVFATSNGQQLPVPVQSAYGAAAYLTEGSAATSVADTGAKVTLNAWTIARMTSVSYQLMQDSAFDIQTILAKNIANAFALKEDGEFCEGAGSGSSAITGVFPNVTVGHQCSTGSTTSFTYSDLLALYYSVGPAYRPQGEFVMADTLMSTLAGLVDDNHRPIWTAGTIPGEPDTLMGKPLYTSPQVTAPAANGIGIVFGDWANGYGIREVAGGLSIKRSDERLIDQLESVFVAWERVDGNVLDAAALRSLQFSAS